MRYADAAANVGATMDPVAAAVAATSNATNGAADLSEGISKVIWCSNPQLSAFMHTCEISAVTRCVGYGNAAEGLCVSLESNGFQKTPSTAPDSTLSMRPQVYSHNKCINLILWSVCWFREQALFDYQFTLIKSEIVGVAGDSQSISKPY